MATRYSVGGAFFVGGDLQRPSSTREVQQRRGDVRARERVELRLDARDQRVAEEVRRAEAGRDQPDGEQGDGDAGDLGAQADAAPPSGDRIRLLRQERPPSDQGPRQAVLPALSM